MAFAGAIYFLHLMAENVLAVFNPVYRHALDNALWLWIPVAVGAAASGWTTTPIQPVGRSPAAEAWLQGRRLMGFFAASAAMRTLVATLAAGIMVVSTAELQDLAWSRALERIDVAGPAVIHAAFLVIAGAMLVGSLFSSTLLGNHTRSMNEHGYAWVATLLCYPPFHVIHGPFPWQISVDVPIWFAFFDPASLLGWLWTGGIAVFLGIEVWAAAALGPRYTELAHRGLVTTGPFRHSKHPGYIARCGFLWLAFAPVFADDLTGAIQSTVILLIISGTFYLRALGEEHHLANDPDYRAYTTWIAEYGLFSRARRLLARRAP